VLSRAMLCCVVRLQIRLQTHSLLRARRSIATADNILNYPTCRES